MSPEILTVAMFATLVLAIILGHPLACAAGLAVLEAVEDGLPARAEALAAARAWSVWEASVSMLLRDDSYVAHFEDPHAALALARIECHYFVNGGFFERDDELLRNIDQVADIPAVIVQGRYDVVCPVESAYELHQAWPGSELVIAAQSGHSALEPEITSHLVAATQRWR